MDPKTVTAAGAESEDFLEMSIAGDVV